MTTENDTEQQTPVVVQSTEKKETPWYLGPFKFVGGFFLKTASILCLRQWPALNRLADSYLDETENNLKYERSGAFGLVHMAASAPLGVASGALDRTGSAIRGTVAEDEAKLEEREQNLESKVTWDSLGWHVTGLATAPIELVHDALGDKPNSSGRLNAAGTRLEPNSDESAPNTADTDRNISEGLPRR